MVRAAERAAHQRPGTSRGADGSKDTGGGAARPDSALSNRQHDGSSAHQSPGRNEVAEAPGDDKEARERGSSSRVHSPSSSPERCVERDRGLGVPTRQGCIHRMAPDERRVPVGVSTFQLGSTVFRIVRKQPQSPSKKVWQSMPGSEGEPGGRAVSGLATDGGTVCVPAGDDHGAGGGEDAAGSRGSSAATGATDSGSPVVSSGAALVGDGATQVASVAEPAAPAALGVQSSAAGSDAAAPLPGENSLLSSQGLSASTLKRLSESRAPSTRAIYDSKWALFCGYCKDRGLKPFEARRAQVANFLEWAFSERRLMPGTLQGYRTAIGAQLKQSNGYDPGADEVISQLIMAFKRARPVVHKSPLKWDFALVLRHLKHGRLRRTKYLSARDLTLKAVFLTLLASGKRRGEVHALQNSIDNVRGDWSAAVLRPIPGFISKTQLRTQGLGKFRELINPAIARAPEYKEDDLALCPVRTLRIYKSRADKYRSPGQKKLFISWMPQRDCDLTTNAISHYVRLLVQEAYESEAQSP